MSDLNTPSFPLPFPDSCSESARSRLLLVSKDAVLRSGWRGRLDPLRWAVSEVTSGAQALEALGEHGTELMLLDPNLPDLDGAEFEQIVRDEYPHLQIVVLAPGGPPLSPPTLTAEPPQGGPGRPQRLLLHVDQPALQNDKHSELGTERGWHELVGASAPMRQVYRAGQLVARKNLTVLIQGESGTGKDLLARAIHLSSARSKQPLVVINCAAIPEALLESELFGHTKGAFTGAAQSRIGRIHAAHGGTLFLDEIGDMPYPLQSKILRFLEQGEVQRIGGTDTLKVDCRVIAATNADLKGLVQDRRFREDLYYRLAIFPIALPPLRERIEDLEPLTTSFVERFCPGFAISAEAMHKLRAHGWPGNVRELRNVLERASLFAEERRVIRAEDIYF